MISKQAERFVIIGVASTAGYFMLVFVFQKALHQSAWISSGLAYVLMFSLTYAIHHRWTFHTTAAHRRSLPRYLMTQVLSLLLTMSGIHGFAGVFPDASALSASAAATLIACGISFFLSSRWVFANDSDPNSQYNVAAPDSLPVKIALYQRRHMFKKFMRALTPSDNDTVLDVGATSRPDFRIFKLSGSLVQEQIQSHRPGH